MPPSTDVIGPASTVATESIGSAVARLTRILSDAGIDTARLDAWLLVGAALGVSPEMARRDPDLQLDAAALARLDILLRRRAEAREPVSRILGRREFWSLDFVVTPDVLDPRPDSEVLVETALHLFPDRNTPLRIADLGTGSGCLLLAVLSERPAATGIGTDASAAALEVARQNAARLGLADRARFRQGNWTDPLDERVDLVLANPPYIPSGEIAGLAPEVAEHDPRGALDGGVDGLDAYRTLAACLPDVVAANGRILLEIGAEQATSIVDLMSAGGLALDRAVSDLAGRDRCLVFQPV